MSCSKTQHQKWMRCVTCTTWALWLYCCILWKTEVCKLWGRKQNICKWDDVAALPYCFLNIPWNCYKTYSWYSYIVCLLIYLYTATGMLLAHAFLRTIFSKIWGQNSMYSTSWTIHVIPTLPCPPTSTMNLQVLLHYVNQIWKTQEMWKTGEFQLCFL